MSRVVRSIAEWEIHAGNPAEKTGERARDLLALEEMLHRRQHLL
jgi:hypothetical protein